MTSTEYATNECAFLEPLAIEPIQNGTFTYAIGAAETKWILNAWQTRLGSSGRWEVRDPREPVPLRDVTLTGTGSDSTAVIIDPTLATYADPVATLFDRQATLAELDTQYLPITAPNHDQLFLPGPYGSILIGLTMFDLAWVILRAKAASAGWNLGDEIGDASTDEWRTAHRMLVPVSKNVACRLLAGNGQAGGLGGLAFVHLPSTWGKVTDPKTYSFRDDFLGAALDTATKWTRAETTVGNVEIVPVYAASKVRGNGAWGGNGAFSQASVAVAAGVKFECDVVPAASGANLVVGFHDGAGHSFSDFAHGIDFTGGNLQIFENGTDRGIVGSGFTAWSLYRVRITLDGTGGATYEVQGGTQYQPIGGAAWTNITPATSSSATNPVHAGMVANGAVDNFVADPKIFT